MDISSQKFYQNQKQIINNQHIPPQLSLPNTAKNSNSQGMSAQSGLQRAVKATSE